MALVGEMKNLTIGNKTYHIPIPTKTSDLQNDSNFMSGMTILSYGTSTWNDFLTAYRANHVVYCRASSNANPASGSQTRMAFMAYVSDATNPTNVEFQYYRSVSSHTSSQQGDQVYVYKLTSANAWTVTVREASVKIKIDTNNGGIKTTYSSGTVSIGHANSVTAQTTQAIYPIKIDAQGHISEYGSAITIPTVDQTYDSTSANAQSGVAVASAIASLPEPMLFKGSLGTGGTITSLPSAAASNEGFVYKVITAGTYASQAAKVGDTFISDGSNWVLIPSGDEPSGTVTSVGVANATNGGLSVSGSPVTSSGVITIGLDTAYGDTKNPYGTKTASYVLAGPTSGSAAAPSFRALVEDDIPDLSNTYLTESSLDGYVKNIEGENWSNTIILDSGEGTASIQMYDRILNKTATIYWSTGDGANDSSTITLEAEKITLDADEILTTFNYTPTLANHFVNKGYVDTAISNSLEIFLIEVSYDEDEEDYVSNKTFSQIQAAIIANKTLLLHFVDEDRFYQCNAYSDDDISFYCLIGTTYYFIIIYNNNAIEIDYEFYNNDRLKWTSTVASNTYYPLVGTTASDSAGQGKTLNGIDFYQYYNTAGGYRRLDLGNSTSWKSTGGAYGTIRLYGTGSTYYGDLIPGTLGTTSGDGHISANRTWTLPDKTGTIALTSDVPDVTGKQDTLVSGTNIKTINNTSLLGSGDITIASSSKNIWYGTCASSSSAENKVVTTISEDFDFQTGSMLRVLFEDANSQPEPYLTVDSGQAGTILRLGTHQVTILSIDRITTATGSSQNYVYNLPSSAITSGENFSAIININSPATSQDVYSDTVVFTAGQSASYQLFSYQTMYLLIEYNGSTSSPQILLRSLYSWSINFWGSVKTGGDTVKSLANYWHAGAVLDFVYDGSRFILSDGGTNYSHDITGTYNSTTKDLTLSVTMS